MLRGTPREGQLLDRGPERILAPSSSQAARYSAPRPKFQREVHKRRMVICEQGSARAVAGAFFFVICIYLSELILYTLLRPTFWVSAKV